MFDDISRLGDIYVLTDEDGRESTMEVADYFTRKGRTYYAMLELDEEGSPHPEEGLFLCTEEPDGHGSPCIVPLTDDRQFEAIRKIFEQRFREIQAALEEALAEDEEDA